MSQGESNSWQTKTVIKEVAKISNVRLQAAALIAVTLIGILLDLLIAKAVFAGMHGLLYYEDFTQAALNGTVSALIFTMHAVVLAGGIELLRARGYRLVKAASIVSLIPICSPGFILGIPIGLWILSTISNARVRDAPQTNSMAATPCWDLSRSGSRWIPAFIIVAVPSILMIAGYFDGRRQYPFGFSHCCDSGLYFALSRYAESHGGAFPAGEATPEASLSLLYGDVDANLLRGKSVPETTVREILERGGRLGPDTCGWHYVEGLRVDDNREIALFWDKAGLNHNGRAFPKGDHEVMLIGCSRKYVSANEWPDFLREQERLLSVLKDRRVTRAEAPVD